MPSEKNHAQLESYIKKEIKDKTEAYSILNEQHYEGWASQLLSHPFWYHLRDLMGTPLIRTDANMEEALADPLDNLFVTALLAQTAPENKVNVVNALNFLFRREFTPPDGTGNGVIIVADLTELRALNTADEEEFPDGTPVFVTYSIPFHNIYDIPDQYTLQRELGLAEEVTFNTIVRPSDFATTGNNFVKTTNLPSNHRYGGPFYHDTTAQRDLWLTQHSNLHTGGSIAIITSEAATNGQTLPGAGVAFSSMQKVGNFLVINKGNLVILDYASGSVLLNIAGIHQVLAPTGNTHILYTTFGSNTLKVHRVNLPALTIDTDLVSLTSVDSYHAQYTEGVLYLAINVTSGTSYVRAYNVTTFTTVGTLNLPASHFTDKLLLIKSGNYLLAYTRTGVGGTETLRIINTTTLTQTKTIAGVYNPLVEMAASLNGVITLGADGNKFHKLDITGGDGSTYAITTLLNLGGDKFWDIRLNEAKTTAYVLINQLANGSGDQYLKKMDLATFAFVNSITDNSILNRPYVLSEGEDKLYLSDNTGATQVRSAVDLSLTKTIAGALGINNFVAESGKIYAGTVSSGKLYEIDPVTDEYIVTSPNGAYWLSKDKTFWNRIIGGSIKENTGDEWRAFETKAALAAYLAPKPLYTQGVVGKLPDRVNFTIPAGVFADSTSIAKNLSRVMYADTFAGIAYVWRADTNVITSFTESGYAPYEVKINKEGTYGAIRWENTAGTLRRFSLVNLSTGVKTTIALPSLSKSTGIDFNSTHCAVNNGTNVHFIALSGFAFTTLVTNIAGDKLAYNLAGDRLAVASNSEASIDVITIAGNLKENVPIGGDCDLLDWAIDNNLGSDVEYIIAATQNAPGISTINVYPELLADYPVKSYSLPRILTNSHQLAINRYNGRVYASYGSSTDTGNSIVELDPYSGELSVFAVPFIPYMLSTDSRRMVVYDGSQMFLWELETGVVSNLTLGEDNGSLTAIMMDENDFNILAGVREGPYGIMKISGLNVVENGVYEKLPTGLRRVGPPGVVKTPLFSPSNDSEGDYGPEITSLQEQDSIFIAQIESLEAQLLELNTSGLGLEPFTVQNGLNVGDLYYKTNDTTYVQASPATEGTAKTRGLVVGESGGNLIGRLMGTSLTPSEIAAVVAAGVPIDQAGTYYLGGTGTPELSPPTTPGYQKKVVLRQGNLQDETPQEIGLEDYIAIEVNTAGTDVVPDYASRLTVTGNSASPFARIASLVGITDGKKLSYINKGDGVMTITGTFSSIINPTLDKHESIELEFFDGDYYIKNRFTI